MNAHDRLPLGEGSPTHPNRVRNVGFPRVDTQVDGDNIRAVPQLNTKQDGHEEGVD